MAADGSKADSYVGSLISLTSKSEIRYEGILYSINTEESSIGLRNVRSFGTEGRKKDGPQVPPSDKVYEYILFRGSDIKDLQVKSSPPVQATSSIDNDPAIIQSHYPCPAATSTSLPTVVTLSSSDANSQTPQLGQPGSNFQGGIPLYQPGGNLGSWGPSPPPPNANATGLAVPMYWPGFYGPPSGLPQMHQQSMLRPPPGLPMPHIQQPMQYPGFNPSLPTGALNLPASNLPELPSSLLNSSSRSSTATSSSLTGTSLPPALSNTMASETLTSSLLNKPPSSVLSMITPNASLSLSSPLNISGMDVNVSAPPASSKASSDSLTSSLADSSTAGQSEAPTPTLVTPDQLLQSGKAPISLPQSSEIAHKDVEVVQVTSASNSSVPVTKDAQPPILPLPPASRALHKPNGGHYQGYQSYRGRGRGRGMGGSRPVTSFTEEFDFMAMNEKFKKEEVWGHLGKSNRSDKKDKGGNGNVSDEDNSAYEDAEFPQAEVKPVYNKDDFFDTLSCNADQDSQNGRTRFSEQMKIDTETFGDFPRYRGGRGGRGYRGGRGRAPNHGRAYGYNSGGGRGYGGYNGSGGRGYDYNGGGSGRGYDYNGGGGGRGYGYNGRGRGRGLSSQAS